MTAVKSATAQDLAYAMDIESSDLVSADLMGSDAAGVGVSDSQIGSDFPTGGSTFAILSTGLASSAPLPNDSEGTSGELSGISNTQGYDLVRLHLQLQVPANFDCANFDFGFYSEEFPEFVGSLYNDTFTAQINDSSLSIDVNDEVIAPGNFAFDSQGNPISVNTVYGVSSATNTTYDGATPPLRARTAVTPGETVDFYISIQDLGDSIYDSAVFLDKFFWSKDPYCPGGAQADTDGDGLMDDWEINGLTVTTDDGEEFINLPAMGADYRHKDIFVEIDYMANNDHTHQPKAAAIDKIVDAFDNAPVDNPDGTQGIHLHVDYGSNAPLTWGAAATWGTLSDADQLTHQTNLGTCLLGKIYQWGAFDSIKDNNFSEARAAVFHYNVWAHDLCAAYGGVSGISRNGLFSNGASDFIVSLGSWSGSVGTVNQQAGTFMHELGHNLGLKHGGPDHTQWKPNYISIMNYMFQTRGLEINGMGGNFDYSRYSLPDLDENNLNETAGIGAPDHIGTYHFCGLDDMRADTDASAVDWNCDGDEEDTGVSYNINQGKSYNNNSSLDTLTSHNDWDNIVYSGGAISQPGAVVDLPVDTEIDDIDASQDAEIPDIPDLVTFPDVLLNHWAVDFVEAIVDDGLTSGYPDGTYRPENPVTRAEMAIFLINSLGLSPATPSGPGPFSDISGHWAEGYILELENQGITGGYTDGTYRPEALVTRAEMAVFLLNAKGVTPPAINGSHPFSDIANHWAESYIEELFDQGITGGYPDGTYRPENQVTRAEMAVFLVNTFEIPLP